MEAVDVRVEYICSKCDEPISEHGPTYGDGQVKMHAECWLQGELQREKVIAKIATSEDLPGPEMKMSEEQVRALGAEMRESARTEHPAQPLIDWWTSMSESDAEATIPKITEYGGVGTGSADLRVMGYALAELAGLHDAPEPVKLELAVWFYGLGKIARLISDYASGRPGKPDSWFDLSVYATMARRIQETGEWP